MSGAVAELLDSPGLVSSGMAGGVACGSEVSGILGSTSDATGVCGGGIVLVSQITGVVCSVCVSLVDLLESKDRGGDFRKALHGGSYANPIVVLLMFANFFLYRTFSFGIMVALFSLLMTRTWSLKIAGSNSIRVCSDSTYTVPRPPTQFMV